MTTDDTDYPPELRDLSPGEFRSLHAKLTLVGIAITKSKPRGKELVLEAYERFRTSRTLPPGVPLVAFLAQVMRSIHSHRAESKAPERRPRCQST